MTPDEALACLEGAAGRVLLIGDSDTGKSTFARELLCRCLTLGRRPALLDADVGQSEVGPPGTLGLALPRSPDELGSALRPRLLYFVGGTSPVGLMLECVAGVARLAREAEALGADPIVVDTTGLVRGPLGFALKVHKADALRPSRIVAFRRGRELDTTLRALDPERTLVVAPGPAVRLKSPQLRALRRQQRWAAYLEHAQSINLPLRRLAFRGSRMGQGRVVTREGLRKLLDGLDARLIYAENQGDTLWGIAESPISREEARELSLRAGTRGCVVTLRESYAGLLVGLLDASGLALAAGLWEGIDTLGLRARILAPRHDPALVRGLALGTVRLRRDGTELGSLRRGEV